MTQISTNSVPTAKADPAPGLRATCTRAEARFPIDAACRFWWTGCSAASTFSCGRTRDVSSRGIFISTSTPPPAGSALMLEVDLPRFSSSPHHTTPYLLLAAEGTVLRTDPAEDGFAARITHAQFANQPEDPLL